MPRRHQSLLLSALGVASLCVGASCGDGTGPREHEVYLQVAADSIECVGAHGPQKCLQVRELVGGDAWGQWTPLFSPIEGFAHEPGFVYDLIAARRRVANPPADGSAYAYRLLRIVSKVVPPA